MVWHTLRVWFTIRLGTMTINVAGTLLMRIEMSLLVYVSVCAMQVFKGAVDIEAISKTDGVVT